MKRLTTSNDWVEFGKEKSKMKNPPIRDQYQKKNTIMVINRDGTPVNVNKEA